MARPSKRRIAEALLERHGRTFADELGIDVAAGTPSPLFRLLVASILFSARIGHRLAFAAARALAEQGWTTPQKLADTTWAQRVRVLNRAGYARYDESTSRMLGDTCALLLERYRGDLRRLREQAERDPRRERALLKEFKGIGDTGVDIFFREAQVAWDELYPFADRRALQAAQRLGLGGDPRALARLVDGGTREFARLVAALVRAGLERDYDGVREQAGR
jgi:endonuclease III